MKKNDILLILAVIAIFVLGFIVMKGKKMEPTLTLTGDAGLHQLSYSEYMDKVNNKEAFVVIIERATCSHCVNFMPVAKEFAEEENLPLYYVDTDTFAEEEWSNFETSNTFFEEKAGQWGTPTTVLLVGSDAYEYIEGETSKSSLKSLYKKYFIMDNKEEKEENE